MSERASTSRRRRSYSPLFWGLWAILVSVAVVAITSTGVDVLAVVTICVVLLALERTLGDWLGEFLGSGLASLVFAAVVGLVAWYAAGARDRSEIEYFFAAAEMRGYRPYFGSASPRSSSHSLASLAGQTPPLRAPINVTNAVAEPLSGRAGQGPPASDAKGTTSHTRTGPLQSLTSLKLSTRMALTGEPVALRAVVTAGGQRVDGGTVEFSVDGRVIDTVALSASGEAASEYSSRVPGRYTVRTKTIAAGLKESEAVAMLDVVPGR